MTTLLLRVEPSGGEPFTYRCEQPSVRIGRSSKAADLAIRGDRFLSRLHARVFREGDEWFIENESSKSGTILNGRAVEGPTRLSAGDTILLADSVVRVGDGEWSGRNDEAMRTPAPDTDSRVFKPVDTLLRTAAEPELDGTGEVQELRRHAKRLKLLNDVHKALARSISADELLEMILDRTFALLQPEEAAIFLEDGGEFRRAMSRKLPHLKDEEYLYSRSLIREVSTKRVAALVVDAQHDENWAQAKSLVASGVRSLLAAPLVDPDGCSGMIVLASRVTVRQFSEDDMELLASLASVAGLQLRQIQLAEEAGRRRELEKELALARRIQIALLPESLPEIQGYAIFASNVPSRTVSGDLYRFEARDDGECYVFVADVSGKGMAASLLTASLEALAAGPMEMGRAPDELFGRLSRRLYQRTPLEKFATAFVAVIHAESETVRYANAGHNPALVVRADGSLEEIGANGVPLGLLPNAAYTCEELCLQPGDSLVVYTDGLTEAENPGGEEYELDRLKAACRRERMRPVEQMAASITADIEVFAAGTPYGDDRTLVIVRRTG